MSHSLNFPAAVPMLVKVVLAGCLVNGNAAAQSALGRSPLEPSGPHERLQFFEGTWTTADSAPDDGFRETCSWLPEARRHMVCRSRWKTDSGVREGMSVFSFDSKSGKYVYTGFRSGGTLVVQQGEESNGRWLFGSDEGIGAARVRSRVTIEGSKDGFDFLAERAVGEGPWVQSAKIAYRRVAR